MLSGRTIAIVVAVVLAAVGILAAFLVLELGERSEQLAASQSTLANTQTTLQETDIALRSAVATNMALESTVAAAQRDNAILANRNERLARDLLGVEARVVLLDSALNQTTQQLSDLQQHHDTLQEGHAALREQNGVLVAEHATLSETHSNLLVQNSRLEAEHRQLRERAGELETLEQRIAELEEQLKPLILGENSITRDWFACTGSMEPVITCLDGAEWRSHFDPADIVVGTTIAFPEASCWPEDRAGSDSYIAHRVTEMEVRNGEMHFWPKGDNNEEADGCWIAASEVWGFIVAIHRNVFPENAALREGVNSSKAAMRSTRTAYRNARASYEALRVRFCGNRTWDNCPLPDHQYNEAIAAWRIVKRAQDNYRAALDEYRCWRQNALDSEEPGHIPNLCIVRIT